MSKNYKDMVTEETIMRELMHIAMDRRMTESRGMEKPVIDPKVKKEALVLLGKIKGMDGLRGDDAKDNSHEKKVWNDLKKAFAESKAERGSKHGGGSEATG